MKIIVAGCGRVGASITEKLVAEGHQVSVIDENPDAVSQVADLYDVFGVVGNIASYEVLKEAGAVGSDLVIAVADSDEVNLLSCLIARKIGGCQTIARVRNPIYNQEIKYIKDELALSMSINPEFLAASEAARLLKFPSAIKIDTFARGRAELMTIQIPEGSILGGIKIKDVRKITGVKIVIAAVESEGEVSIPNGEYELKAGDHLAILAPYEEARQFFTAIGMNTGKKISDVMIVGGGNLGFYVARSLSNMGMSVKIIESDKTRCERLSELLPKVTVINGDTTNRNLLNEEGIKTVDAFVATTGIDEGNVFLSMYAKQVNEEVKAITLVDRINYGDLVEKLSIGSIISPKNIVANNVVKYVRGLSGGYHSDVEALYQLMDDKIEAVEFVIKEDGPVCGVPLKDMKLKENTLVAAVGRNGEVIYPNGLTTLTIGDRVIIVTKEKLNNINDILDK